MVKQQIQQRWWLDPKTATTIAIVLQSLTLAPSAYSQPGSITLSPQFSPNPIELRGSGGGATPVNEIVGRAATPTGPCTGFANSTPDHSVTLTAFFKSLDVEVESPQDTALAIRGPGGIWCNDDFKGKNPGVNGQWLPGRYDIWVSTYTKNRTAPYVLKLIGR